MTQATDQLLRYKGYAGSVEVSLDDGCLHGQVLHIDDTVVYGGDTVAELRQQFEQAVDAYLSYCGEIGKQPQKPYGGSFNVRVGADRHRWLAERSVAEGRPLNDVVCRLIDAARDMAAVRAMAKASVGHLTSAASTVEPEVAREQVRRQAAAMLQSTVPTSWRPTAASSSHGSSNDIVVVVQPKLAAGTYLTKQAH